MLHDMTPHAGALALVPVAERLPQGFDAMCAEARAEGHRFLDRLSADWDSGAGRFNHPGEALLAAHVAGELAGIGGITIDPVLPGAFRMRRFYVRPAFRRSGIARRLAETLLRHTAPHTARPITVNAGTRDAWGFWEKLGFQPDAADGHTHVIAVTPDRAGLPR